MTVFGRFRINISTIEKSLSSFANNTAVWLYNRSLLIPDTTIKTIQKLPSVFDQTTKMGRDLSYLPECADEIKRIIKNDIKNYNDCIKNMPNVDTKDFSEAQGSLFHDIAEVANQVLTLCYKITKLGIEIYKSVKAVWDFFKPNPELSVNHGQTLDDENFKDCYDNLEDIESAIKYPANNILDSSSKILDEQKLLGDLEAASDYLD